LTLTEDYIIREIEALGILGALGVSLISIGITTAVMISPSVKSYSSRPVQIDFRGPLYVLGFMALVLTFLIVFITLREITKFRTQHPPTDRDALRKSIEGLKERLAQRTMK
jgi:hypothetical protein